MNTIECLPLRVPQRRGEPASALLARAALYTGLGGEREYAAMFGMRFEDVARGKCNERLAALLRLDPDVVADWTPLDVDGTDITLRGETLRVPHDLVAGTGATRRIRACPSCLREDLDCADGGPVVARPYMRAWWLMRDVYTCPAHRCALVEVARGGRILSPTRAPEARLRAFWGGIGDAVAEPISPEDAFADAYVIGRLGAGPRIDIPFLDALPLGQASAVMSWVGEMAVSGTKASYVRKLPFAEAARMRSAGIRACLDWPTGLEKLLRQLQEAVPGSVRGLKGRFGRFYSRLYDDRGSKGDHEVRAVLRDFMRSSILQNVPLEREETVFRLREDGSRRITLKHAAHICGVRTAEMMATARSLGLLEHGDMDGRAYGVTRDGAQAARKELAECRSAGGSRGSARSRLA